MRSHPLPPPETMLARWGANAAALTAIGCADVWWVDDRGAHHDDHGGNWAKLVLVEGGRAVLFGNDHEYSRTTTATPPIDLLAGAPAWVPWSVLIPHAESGLLGYAYWHEDGAWQRVEYPPGVDDGIVPTAGAVLTAEAAVEALRDVVFEWGEHEDDSPAEDSAVTEAASAVMAAAERGRIDAAVLGGLLNRLGAGAVDLAAGEAMAARAGLVPGSAPPVQPASTAIPPRRVRVLSDDQLWRLVGTAMRRGEEIPRPLPAPTPELDAIVAWARERSPRGDGRCSLLLMVHDHGGTEAQGEFAPLDPFASRALDSADAFDLADDLREAEADPESGRWFFLRLETTASDFTVERRYDSTPDWVPDGGSWVPGGLAQEMARRAPRFRPPWSVLLAEDVVHTGPPAPYDSIGLDG